MKLMVVVVGGVGVCSTQSVKEMEMLLGFLVVLRQILVLSTLRDSVTSCFHCLFSVC